MDSPEHDDLYLERLHQLDLAYICGDRSALDEIRRVCELRDAEQEAFARLALALDDPDQEGDLAGLVDQAHAEALNVRMEALPVAGDPLAPERRRERLQGATLVKVDSITRSEVVFRPGQDPEIRFAD